MGAERGDYLGEFGHQRAVLQSEVFLLTVQLPLKHLIFTQQGFHLLQQPTHVSKSMLLHALLAS